MIGLKGNDYCSLMKDEDIIVLSNIAQQSDNHELDKSQSEIFQRDCHVSHVRSGEERRTKLPIMPHCD